MRSLTDQLRLPRRRMTAGPADPTLSAAVPPVLPLRPRRPAPADDLPPTCTGSSTTGVPPAEREAPRADRAARGACCSRGSPALAGASRRHAATLAAAHRHRRRCCAPRPTATRTSTSGRLFTRCLTRAVPDLVFLPVTVAEVEAALRWARDEGVAGRRCAAPPRRRWAARCPATAGSRSTSRVSTTSTSTPTTTCACVGAGARLRTMHRRLAERELALPVYPSNLGGTFAGWFVDRRRRASTPSAAAAPLDIVRAADVVLPVRRARALPRRRAPRRARRRAAAPGHREVAADAAEAWFRGRGLEPFGLADLAGSEGMLGVVVQLVLAVGRGRSVGAFLLALRQRARRLRGRRVDRRRGRAHARRARPTSSSCSARHLHHLRAVWADEDARPWRRLPSALLRRRRRPGAVTAGSRCGRRPTLGAASRARERRPTGAGAYLFVDFLGLRAARAFAARLPSCPGAPLALDAESVRFAAERFRPQQTKRLGPGLLAAEIVLPAGDVSQFLPRAVAPGAQRRRRARPRGLLRRRRRGAGDRRLPHRPPRRRLRPSTSCSRRRCSTWRCGASAAGPTCSGAGRRRSPPTRFGADGARAAARAQGTASTRSDLLNRGVVLGMGLRGLLGAAHGGACTGRASSLRAALWSTPGARRALGARRPRRPRPGSPGPPSGRGEAAGTAAGAPRRPARRIHCVNCGECNSVCPVFDEAKIRLPQMLTHLGEALHAGERAAGQPARRCSTCACAAATARRSARPASRTCRSTTRWRGARRRRPRRRERERHVALAGARCAARRATARLPRRAPGRVPAPRAGRAARRRCASSCCAPRTTPARRRPASTAAPACRCARPSANREFERRRRRASITTDRLRCIGCGTCVEVCPANQRTAGRRCASIEAPTPDWFAALDEFETAGRPP